MAGGWLDTPWGGTAPLRVETCFSLDGCIRRGAYGDEQE